MRSKLYEYVILWHPTEKQAEEGKKTEILVNKKTILASDANTASMTAMLDLPENKRNNLDQIEIAIRPF